MSEFLYGIPIYDIADLTPIWRQTAGGILAMPNNLESYIYPLRSQWNSAADMWVHKIDFLGGL
jgi:hypothetical protein